MRRWLWLLPAALLAGGLLIGDAAALPAPAGSPVGSISSSPPAGAAPAGTIPPPGIPPIAPPRLATPLDATAAPAQPPVALRIPAIGVDHPLVSLAADAAGVLVPPESPAEPGWFAGGSVPGEVGPAVIAGHVDSRSGPGVFYRLGRLRPGDEIVVQRTDGVAYFEVRSIETVRKTEFPTERVYGPVPVPELRLITCGGDFAYSTGHYVDNVIVRATLTRLARTPSE